MNGSENAYAGALFFALISLGAVLKIDDIMIGGGVGAACALLAAIFFRIAINKSAQAAEEDHQRMEVQFQQLRTKIIEATESSLNTVNSLGEVTQLLQKNLQLMNNKQTELNNLTKLAKNIELIYLTLVELNNKQFEPNNFSELAKNVESINLNLAELNNKNFEPNNFGELVENVEAIKSSIVGLEENSFAVNTGLEKISVAVQNQKKSSDSDEFKKLIQIEDTNKANLQTALKILHVIAQIVRNTSYEKDLEKINSSLENLAMPHEVFDEIKISIDAAQKNLSEIVKINGNLSRSFTTTLDDLRLDMVKLSAKLEELNDMMNKNKTAAIEENVAPSKKSRRR